MDEYNLITHIISSEYVSGNQQMMCETKAKDSTKVTIRRDGVNDYILYRFDLEKKDFLPFFCNTGDAHHHPPRRLREFCDYVILAVCNSKLCILLVEMKSGGTAGAKSQLDASELFMTYVRDTADRIYQQNNVLFDKSKVYIKKIILKNRGKSPVKPTTNVRDSQPEWKDPYLYIDWRDFSLGCICKRI